MAESPLWGKFELYLYGGYATEIASGTAVDVGVIWYGYPGNRSGAGPADYVEFSGKLSHDIGPLSATGTVAYAPAQRSMRSEEHTSELQSLMRISYAVFCLKKTASICDATVVPDQKFHQRRTDRLTNTNSTITYYTKYISTA